VADAGRYSGYLPSANTLRAYLRGDSHESSNAAVAGASIFELLVAIYGGYFGGGIGIMNLAMLAAVGMTDMHAMNALKVVLGGVINGVATFTFIATGRLRGSRGS